MTTPASDQPDPRAVGVDPSRFRLSDRPERGRYELHQDERLIGFVEYSLDGATRVVPHAEVAPELRGHGVGDRLVSAVLDDIRARGGRVLPTCGFVAGFMAANPTYHDLLV